MPEQLAYIGNVGNFLPIVVNDVFIPHYNRPERIQVLYGGSGCFIPGTLVRTENGLQAIESIKKGDFVLSFSESKQQPEYKKVLNTFCYSAVHLGNKFVTFVMPTYKIVCTSNHEFYINGTWVAAGIIAERIMAGDTRNKRAVLHKQQRAAFNNQALCNIESQKVPGGIYEARFRCTGVFKDNDLNKREKQDNKNAQTCSTGMDSKPYELRYCKPQRLRQDKQLCGELRVDVTCREYSTLSGDGAKASCSGGGYDMQYFKGVASIGNKGICEGKQEAAQDNSFGKVWRFQGNNKRCGSAEKLDASTIDIFSVVDCFFSDPKGYVYDLCVEGNHNYCITEDNIIVHNSGKSDWKATELLIKVLTQPYCRVLFVRKHHVTVRHSQFQLLKDQIARYQLHDYFTVLETPMTIKCINGNVMLSGGLDDVDKLKSIADISDVWIEEPLDKNSSITADDFFELDRRVRTTKTTNHIHLTFNPISQDSWIHDFFFKATDYEPFVLKTTYLDNYFSPKNQHLTFERLKVRNYQQYLVYALGEWGTLTEGLVFKEYSIVPDFPSDADKQGYGLDFGFYPDPTALVRCGIYEGKLYIDEIMYDYNMTSHIRAKTMKERQVSAKLRIIADRNPEAIKEISGLGFPKIEGAEKGPGSIKAGLELLGNYPICITARSVNLKKELDNYSWVIDKRTGKPTGDPIDEWNHAIDAARYWASKHITSKKEYKRPLR